jgi:hypothetical protein
LAVADFDRDGDVDLLLTTNGGPAFLFRNDQLAANHSIRFCLTGTKSNRDAIGASLRIYLENQVQSRMVHSGGSYLSQSELPITFGLGPRNNVDRLVIDWPSGRSEEFKNLTGGRAYRIVESQGISPLDRF